MLGAIDETLSIVGRELKTKLTLDNILNAEPSGRTIFAQFIGNLMIRHTREGRRALFTLRQFQLKRLELTKNQTITEGALWRLPEQMMQTVGLQFY